MRSLRPPPKVTPPKPPAHLFEPRDDIVPIRLEKKMDDVKPYNFEDDVKFQMQQLENEMKLMLVKDRGSGEPTSVASQFDRRVDPRVSYGSLHAPEPFPERINPSDWKAKGFPSEYAYMKATGQLDMPSSKPISETRPQFNETSARDSKSNFDPGFVLQNKQQSVSQFPETINPKDWRAKGFASEYAYMKASGQLDIPSNKPIPPMFDSNLGGNRDSKASYDPRSVPYSEPNASSNERQQYEKEIVSPARRKGGALQNLYVEEDELRRKFASQHSYSDQLHQQAAQQRQAREAEQQAHRGVGGAQPGGDRNGNMGMRLPSERGPINGRPQPPQPYGASPAPVAAPAARGHNEAPPTGYRGGPGTERYDPAALAYGAERNRAPASDPFHRSAPVGGVRPESLYEAKQTSPADRRLGGAPVREEVNTGLLLGLDKNSEKALKRAKQEEYKRQLDQMQPRPAVETRAAPAESKPHMTTGARHAPERYDPRIPPASQFAPSAYPPASYRETRPPLEYFAAKEGLRDPYDAPAPSIYQPDQDYQRYLNERDSQAPPARYPPSEYGYDAPYVGYPGPEPGYARGAPGPGAPGGRGGPSPLRQAPPGRQEDPYRQTGPPHNATYDYPQSGQGRPDQRGPAQASHALPAESQEKAKKRLEQEAYRRELEAQMELKNAKKMQTKKEEEQIDQKFLQQITAAEASNPANARGKKGQAQSDWQAPPASQQQPVPYGAGGRGPTEMPERGAPPRVAPAVPSSSRPNASQYADDVAAEYEFLKAQMAQLEQQQANKSHARPGPGADLFERGDEGSHQRNGRDPGNYHDVRDSRNDDRSDFDPRRQEQFRNQDGPGSYQGNAGGASDYNREHAPQGSQSGYGGRSLDINTDYSGPSNGNGSSPYKSPNQARTRMMKDIYGADLITHSKPDPQQGGNWRATMGGMNDRKREVIADQKAALDKQIFEDNARKEKEKNDEKEKDRVKEERDRNDRERIADAERQEKRKKDQFNENAARDLAELQQKKEQEALARKGRGAPKTTTFQGPEQDDVRTSNAKPNQQTNRAEPPYVRDQGQGRGAPMDHTPSAVSNPRAEYDHINSPVRDIIQQQHQQQLQMMMASQQSANYGHGGGGGGISLYDGASVDQMDRFLRERRFNDAQGGGGNGGNLNYPPAGYLPPPQQQRGYEPSPASSYSQPPYGQFGQRGEYPPFQVQHQPPHQAPYYPQPQQDFYPARGNFYAPDNDISLVAESRLLPANPFSSSDILSSLVPIGATAHANANASINGGAPKRTTFNARSEMEKSMASDSAMIYIGQRTPLLEPGATRPNLQNSEPAVAGMPSRKIHSAGRPASAANAKLSDVIEEANRAIELERQKNGAGGAAERISPKKDYNSYNSDPALLGENDGISTTVYRQNSRTRYDNDTNTVADNLDGVPKNRIFLNQNQKPRYEDDPAAAPVVENDVAGYDDNLARSLQLLDSAEKLPLKERKVAADMSTQTSEFNLLALATATAEATESAPHSARKSPRKHHPKDHGESEGKKHHRHSPRKSPRSPRVEALALESEVDSEPVPIDGTFYTYGISPRVDGSDTPDSYMSSMKYEPPFSPAPVQQLAPTVVEGETGEENVEAVLPLRRNLLDANAHLVKSGDHRSPRQRALDNKQAREAAVASGVELPARKHLPVEEEIADLTSPQVPRLPRKNILDANEALLQAPSDNRYRSPRQRALDRESSKKSDFSPRVSDTVDSTELVVSTVDPAESDPRDAQEDTADESDSRYLPFVENGSVDDTRFNEWPAEENIVETGEASNPPEDDFPPEDYAQDPEYVEVENTDEAYTEQEEYQSDQQGGDDTHTENAAPVEGDASWDNYASDEVFPDVVDAAAYEQSYEQPNPDLAQDYEQEYEPEFEQEYEGEVQPAYEPDAEAPTEPAAEETAPEYPEYGNEDEYSYVVESNMPYEYYEDDEEEEVTAPQTQSSGTVDTAGAEPVPTFETQTVAEAEDEVNLAESVEPQVPRDEEMVQIEQNTQIEDILPVYFLPEVLARSSKSRPSSSRPRTGNGNANQDEHTGARPTTGRPKSSSRVIEPPFAETEQPVSVVSSSRPASGRPKTGAPMFSRVDNPPEEITIASDIDTPHSSRPSADDQSHKDTSASLLISSRPSTSGRPRSVAPLSSRKLEGSEQSISDVRSSRPTTSSRSKASSPTLTHGENHAEHSTIPSVSRPGTSGRPRTGSSSSTRERSEPGEASGARSSRPGSSAPLSSRFPDVLEQAISDSAAATAQPSASSRPATGRLRTSAPSLSSEVPDALELAVNEVTGPPIISRPATSSTRRPRSDDPLSSCVPDAVEHPPQSRPGTSSRPRTGAHMPLSSDVPDALDQAIKITVPPVASRPSTSGRPRTGQQSLSARVPDALEQAVSEAALHTPTVSRPPTSSRPRTGGGGARSPEKEIDALDQALAWSAPSAH